MRSGGPARSSHVRQGVDYAPDVMNDSEGPKGRHWPAIVRNAASRTVSVLRTLGAVLCVVVPGPDGPGY